MNRIPLISSSAELGHRVESAMALCRHEPPAIELLNGLEEAVVHLNTEMPDLLLIHFPDPELDAFALLDAVMRDPWLVHGGIIAVCDDDDTIDRLENLRDVNLVVILPQEGLEQQLPRILDIIHGSRRILFQREIGSDLVRDISGHFELNSCPLEARCYANLICNFLFYANRIDASARDALNLAIYEILANAIEHGNCGITYAEKTAWLEDHTTVEGLIERRLRQPEIARRKVVIEYSITPSTSQFVIADEGAGFNWREMADTTNPADIMEVHGRGILLARTATQNLTYNDKGNEVRFELAHRNDETNLTPALLAGIEPREFEPGEPVFAEGAPGDSLYYIAKGRYDVFAGDRSVACLTPEDIFLGEMSFLLNHRRSATVRARTAGKLIEISKRGFMDAVRTHPHYALLLARLLAQRIERANTLYRE